MANIKRFTTITLSMMVTLSRGKERVQENLNTIMELLTKETLKMTRKMEMGYWCLRIKMNIRGNFQREKLLKRDLLKNTKAIQLRITLPKPENKDNPMDCFCPMLRQLAEKKVKVKYLLSVEEGKKRI